MRDVGGWAIAVLLAGTACVRVPATVSSPTEPAEPPPTPVVAEVEPGPLACDGTLAAIIGDRGIGMVVFEDLYVLKLRKHHEAGREVPKSADARYHRSVSERVIHQELLALEAAKLGLEIDPAAVTAREQAEQHGIKDWPQHLLRRGESEASLRDLYLAELRQLAILDATGQLAVSDDEVLAEYEAIKPDYVADEPRIRAAHVLIRIDAETPDPDALARAEAVYALARQPDADFAALAETWSEGTGARSGGALGVVTAGRMVPELAKVAFAPQPGEVSPPVRSKLGYHVIRVDGVWGPGELPLAALEPSIRERLAARKLLAGRRALKARLLAEYAPINCIAALARERGLGWSELERGGVSAGIQPPEDAEPQTFDDP